VALAKFDFKGFSNIGAAMREDAEKARKDIDAFSARLLNPTKPASAPAPAGKGGGIVTLPVAPATRRGGGGGGSAVSEGQRLIEQLKDRLRATEHLTEVESLQERLADGRYKKVTLGEREIALGIAAQIDARKALTVELDAELAAVRVLTDEYSAQDARLKSLVSSTDVFRNTQNMLDEALAESALLAGKIDTAIYDQIIEKLHEVKDEGKDTFKELQDAIEGWGKSSAAALVDFAMTGKMTFSGLVNSIIKDILRMTVQQNITGPLAKAAGTWVGDLLKAVLPSTGLAKGGVISGSPSLHAYANTVQTTPKTFAFQNLHGFARGGVFGEAGPEAVMPLSRDSQGRLGVKSQGGGGVAISITVNEGDGVSSVRSKGEKSSEWKAVADRIRAVVLEELNTQKRPGGALYA